MSQNLNEFSLSATSEFNDSVIDDVIANMAKSFPAEGVDGSTLQQLEQLWRSKLQKSANMDGADMAHTSGSTEATDGRTKKDEEKQVPGQQALATQSAAVAIRLKWVLREDKMPQDLPTRRHHISTALQLDGGLPEIMEEMEESFSDSDNSSLNSDDDPVGDDADDEGRFRAENVIFSQFEKVGRYRRNWKIELAKGMMRLNGKEYVFHQCSGEAPF